MQFNTLLYARCIRLKRQRIRWLALAMIVAGCSSAPPAIEVVDFDADSAGEMAMEAYDQDGDDCLSKDELSRVPGILKYQEKYDADKDGCVSEAEIAARVESWSHQGVGLRTLIVEVLLDDRPLPGAQVRMIPEAYLGDGPKPAAGKTDSSGAAKMSVAPEFLPEDLRQARMRGVFAGTYRIAVEHPKTRLPEKYVAGNALGDEIARDTVGDRILLELSSR